MNETIKVLKERRSIRKFKPDMLPKETIQEIIDAGLYAASGMGKQAVKIIAVTNKELRDEISKENCKIGGWKPDFDPFYGAPVMLIVLADKSMPTSIYDGSLVMGNLMNAAKALDIGNIWIHRAKEEFDSEFGKKILQQAGIEGEWEGIGHCALGYVDGDVQAAAERKADRVYWID